MTDAEAQQFVARLKAGERFATRHQEQEWGIKVRPGGRFEVWHHDAAVDPPEKSSDMKTEPELVSWLMQHYSYDVLCARLRPV